jgi:hypothetical protein
MLCSIARVSILVKPICSGQMAGRPQDKVKLVEPKVNHFRTNTPVCRVMRIFIHTIWCMIGLLTSPNFP